MEIFNLKFFIVSLFVIGAAAFKGMMDEVAFDPLFKDLWKSKWKLTDEGNLILNTSKKWYHFGLNPKYIEAFPYSSTLLVFLTDVWHMSQFLMLRCFYIAIGYSITDSILYTALLAFIGFPILYFIGFFITFEKNRSL